MKFKITSVSVQVRVSTQLLSSPCLPLFFMMVSPISLIALYNYVVEKMVPKPALGFSKGTLFVPLIFLLHLKL